MLQDLKVHANWKVEHFTEQNLRRGKIFFFFLRLCNRIQIVPMTSSFDMMSVSQAFLRLSREACTAPD